MDITTSIQHVVERISEIQGRIQSLELPVIPPVPPVASAAAAVDPTSFQSALRSATTSSTPAAMPYDYPSAVAPDGESIRPLSPSPTIEGYEPLIQQSAKKYGLDPSLIRSVMQTESSGNPDARSRAGAMGLMQLMPSNVDELGISNPWDPAQNIDGGAHQLADLLSKYNGDLNLTLAGYNAGPGAVQRYGGVPPYPETQDYVRKVRGLMGK